MNECDTCKEGVYQECCVCNCTDCCCPETEEVCTGEGVESCCSCGVCEVCCPDCE